MQGIADAFPEQLALGDVCVPLEVRVHPRARHLKLTADPTRHHIRLTVPKRCALDTAQEFLHSRHDWIARQASSWAQPMQLADGSEVDILGASIRLEWTEAVRGVVSMQDGIIYVPGPLSGKGRRVEAFLKAHLQRFVTPHVERYAARLGVTVKSIAVHEVRSRWGSCASDGALHFNWRLVFAPPSVVEYVVAHEVAHRVHMDHSRDFWDVVTALYPAHPAARRWLKRHGDALYRYQCE